MIGHWYHKKYSPSDTKVLLKSFPVTNLSHRIVDRRERLVRRTPCEGQGMSSTPSIWQKFETFRMLTLDFHLIYWLSRLISMKVNCGKRSYLRSTIIPVLRESVLESQREAESSSTSFAQRGLMKAVRKKG